jgi:hypothetical protein
MSETVLIILTVVILGCVAIMAVLLYNFMQLLSTLNKRMISIISDILGNINLSTPQVDSLLDHSNELKLDDVLEEDEESSGFNPHNYNPFKEEDNE